MRALQSQVDAWTIDPNLSGEHRADWLAWRSLPVLDGSTSHGDDVWATIRAPARRVFYERAGLSKGKQAI